MPRKVRISKKAIRKVTTVQRKVGNAIGRAAKVGQKISNKLGGQSQGVDAGLAILSATNPELIPITGAIEGARLAGNVAPWALSKISSAVKHVPINAAARVAEKVINTPARIESAISRGGRGLVAHVRDAASKMVGGFTGLSGAASTINYH